MDRTAELLLESWDRNAAIVSNLANLVTEETLDAVPAPHEWTVGHHLCHIHEVRWFWLSRVSKPHCESLGDLFAEQSGASIASRDLGLIRSELAISAKAVRDAVAQLLESGVGPVGGYDNPVLFLQHMIWHDGWHVGEIMMALRQAGREPGEAWEEPNIWGQWRTEE